MKRNQGIKNLRKKIEDIRQRIFFYDVSALIRINNQVDSEIQTRPFPDLIIEVVVTEQNLVNINVRFGEDFLVEYLPIWNKKIRNRGLDISIKSLLKEILKESERLTLQGLKLNQVSGVIQGLFLLQILQNLILRNGKLPRGIWYSKHPDYCIWKEYITLNPIVAGQIDGFIDEIIGLPTAISGLYDIMVDDQVQQTFLDTFEASTACVGLIDLYQQEDKLDLEMSKHRAGKKHWLKQLV